MAGLTQILVFNTGSSTLKFGCFEAHTLEARAIGLVDWSSKDQAEIVLKQTGKAELRSSRPIKGHGPAVQTAVELLSDNDVIEQSSSGAHIAAIGHRVVHGGTKFRSCVRIDAAVKSEIAELSELAPLHNPPALESIAAAERIFPATPHVAVFDTSFFTDLDPRRYVYPLPYEWYAEWGIRRFGFHGISHHYCAERAAEMLRRKEAGLRVIVCHLGNGCSGSAIRDGRPVATTMGFTPLEGLMMGSRPGSLDPGILTHASRKKDLSAEKLDRILNNESGLLGVSGVSSDFRRVETAAQDGNQRARLALDMYVDRIRSAVGSLAVTLGGVDALVFTAGVGEHSARLRVEVCEGLSCLGLDIDEDRNKLCWPDQDISSRTSKGRILVVHTEEEAMVARQAKSLLDGAPAKRAVERR